MKNNAEKNYSESSFTDFNIFSILLSRPVRIIIMLIVMLTVTYFLGK